MKKVLIALVAFASTTAVFAQPQAGKKVVDVAKFSTDTYDLGKMKQSVPATATFTVTNISHEPLLIEAANPTCGCTISDYTKAPIAPGQSGTIKATYNASGSGAIHKTLTVKFAGVDEIKSINLSGEVLDAAAYDKWVAENPTPAGSTKMTVKDDGNKIKTQTTLANVTTTTTTKKNKKHKKVDKTVVKS